MIDYTVGYLNSLYRRWRAGNKDARDEVIFILCLAGVKQREIALDVGVSLRRVNQIWNNDRDKIYERILSRQNQNVNEFYTI